MIQLYRIMTGIDNLQSSKFIKMEKGITIGHIFKAFKPRASSKIKRNTLGYMEQSMNGIHYQTAWSVLKI